VLPRDPETASPARATHPPVVESVSIYLPPSSFLLGFLALCLRLAREQAASLFPLGYSSFLPEFPVQDEKLVAAIHDIRIGVLPLGLGIFRMIRDRAPIGETILPGMARQTFPLFDPMPCRHRRLPHYPLGRGNSGSDSAHSLLVIRRAASPVCPAPDRA